MPYLIVLQGLTQIQLLFKSLDMGAWQDQKAKKVGKIAEFANIGNFIVDSIRKYG